MMQNNIIFRAYVKAEVETNNIDNPNKIGNPNKIKSPILTPTNRKWRIGFVINVEENPKDGLPDEKIVEYCDVVIKNKKQYLQSGSYMRRVKMYKLSTSNDMYYVIINFIDNMGENPITSLIAGSIKNSDKSDVLYAYPLNQSAYKIFDNGNFECYGSLKRDHGHFRLIHQIKNAM